VNGYDFGKSWQYRNWNGELSYSRDNGESWQAHQNEPVRVAADKGPSGKAPVATEKKEPPKKAALTIASFRLAVVGTHQAEIAKRFGQPFKTGKVGVIGFNWIYNLKLNDPASGAVYEAVMIYIDARTGKGAYVTFYPERAK
jgi:hypothetical protein